MSHSSLQSPRHVAAAPLHSNGTAEAHRFEELLHTRIVRINATAFATVVAVMAGLVLFLLTNYLVLKGGRVVGPHLALLGQVLIGYRVTFVGSLIGASWAGAIGWLFAYLGARIYNAIAAFRED